MFPEGHHHHHPEHPVIACPLVDFLGKRGELTVRLIKPIQTSQSIRRYYSGDEHHTTEEIMVPDLLLTLVRTTTNSDGTKKMDEIQVSEIEFQGLLGHLNEDFVRGIKSREDETLIDLGILQTHAQQVREMFRPKPGRTNT